MNAAGRQWHSGEVLEVSQYFWKTRAVQPAVKLAVFACIGDGYLTG
jgi:hypothetical protein